MSLVDTIKIQQDVQPTPKIRAEKSQDNTDENQETALTEDYDEVLNEKLPTNTRGE